MGNQQIGEAVASETEALYVYCIVPGSHEISLGPLGLDMSEVRVMPGGETSAVVHRCRAAPYESKDPAVVEKWVAAQHRVVEAACERFGSVLPMSFDMIVRGSESVSARENLIKWLQEKQDPFTRQLKRLAGKAEYGVQVSWDPKIVADVVIEGEPDLQQIQRKTEGKPDGLAYVWRAKLQKAVKERMEARAAEYFVSFHARIRSCVQDLRVEPPKKTEDGTQMLLNVSCLIDKGGHSRLGQVLDQIAETRGIKVHFTGPWPPYSFVGAG